MFEALVVLLVLSLVLGLGTLAVKIAVSLVLLPFKLLAWLVGGLVSLVVVVPLVLAGVALMVALAPVVLILAALALPLLVAGAVLLGLCAL